MSDYVHWNQKTHAQDWLLFPENIGSYLSIDETCLYQGELYTLVTNKAAKGKKGSLVAVIKGVKSEDIITVLKKLARHIRWKVKEVTMDMAANLEMAIKYCFPCASRVTDRFHVHQLVHDAVQEIRIKYRWQTLDQEMVEITTAKARGESYIPHTFSNGDTRKQLLARSRYLLFKKPTNWSYSQEKRATILFYEYPLLKKAYHLSLQLGLIFHQSKDKVTAYTRLARWYDQVDKANLSSFATVARTIESHYQTILNYFDRRSTNASAESFNAKIKAFRRQLRGVRDINFFLYRVANIYA